MIPPRPPPAGRDETASAVSSGVPSVLRAAAAILRARGRIEIPNAMDNDTDPVDAVPLAEWLEEIATQREEIDRPDLNIISETAAIAFARAVVGGQS